MWVSRLFLFAQIADYILMNNDERQQVVKSQAALDQTWAMMEIMLPKIIELGDRRITTDVALDDAELATSCVHLVGWELTMRAMQRDTHVRCLIFKGLLPNEVAVRITSLDGHVTFFVPRDQVVFPTTEEEEACVGGLISCKGKLKVKAYRTSSATYAVVLPTEFANVINVPSVEIIVE